MPQRVGSPPVQAPRPATLERPAAPAATTAVAVPQTAGWTAKPVQRGLAPAPVSTGEYPTSANGTPIFKQGDAEWGRTRLGKGGATIPQAGCAMPSTAMAMSKITGKRVDDKGVTRYLANDPGTGKEIELVMQKGRLVGDGKDALGKYRSAGTMRVFSGSLELG